MQTDRLAPIATHHGAVPYGQVADGDVQVGVGPAGLHAQSALQLADDAAELFVLSCLPDVGGCAFCQLDTDFRIQAGKRGCASSAHQRAVAVAAGGEDHTQRGPGRTRLRGRESSFPELVLLARHGQDPPGIRQHDRVAADSRVLSARLCVAVQDGGRTAHLPDSLKGQLTTGSGLVQGRADASHRPAQRNETRQNHRIRRGRGAGHDRPCRYCSANPPDPSRHMITIERGRATSGDPDPVLLFLRPAAPSAAPP